MGMNEKLLEELMKDYKKPEDLLGDNGLLKQLTKALLEKALEGEMTHHFGYPKWSPETVRTPAIPAMGSMVKPSRVILGRWRLCSPGSQIRV